jgi:hypothetical protein
MELLLNLAWLLLALPAYWLWRSRATRKVSSLQCLLALGCLLVMLFPVVSATDDLRAMRAEMEESPTSKRGQRQAGIDKSQHGTGWQSPAAVVVSNHSFATTCEGWLPLSSPFLSAPAAPGIQRSGRAPPSSFLG